MTGMCWIGLLIAYWLKTINNADTSHIIINRRSILHYAYCHIFAVREQYFTPFY